MKRKLRFRAWNPKENKFEYLDVLHSHSLGTTLPIPSRGLWDDLKDFEQFIGLVDKNNKYIFEGDVVKVTMPNASTPEKTIIVEFSINNEIGICGYLFPASDGKQMEIIGNIHENPELL